MEYPWRWDGGTISTNLDVIWGMSDQKPEEMTLTDVWHANYDNPKTCALCGKDLESGKWFYVSVRAGLREKYVCKACLKDRKGDKTEKKWG